MSYPSKCAISSILLPNPTLSILERWMLVVSQGRRPWFRSKITSGCRFAKSSLLVPPGDFHFSFSPALDPIISCPLSGSVCYAIGLRGPNRRAVCFVSLIAERLSGGPLSLLPLSLHPVCHPSLRSPSSPFSFVPSAERRSGAAAILFLENDQQARTFVRSFSRRNAGSQLFLSFSSSFFFSSPLLSLSLSLFLSFFGRVAAPRMVAPWPTALLTAMRLEEKERTSIGRTDAYCTAGVSTWNTTMIRKNQG